MNAEGGLPPPQRPAAAIGWCALALVAGLVSTCSDETAAATSTTADSSASTGPGGGATGGGGTGGGSGGASAGGSGGTTTSTGGSGGGIGTTCATFGEVAASCLEHCSFANEQSASSALGSACQAGIDALPAVDADIVSACLECATEAVTASCLVPFPFNATIAPLYYGLDVTPECETTCQAVAGPSGNKLADWLSLIPGDLQSAVTCDNGWQPLTPGSCESFGTLGDPETCEICCCNGLFCQCTDQPPPEVGASCVGNGPIVCTCTLGAKTGSTFQLSDCSAIGDSTFIAGLFDDATTLWDHCNL